MIIILPRNALRAFRRFKYSLATWTKMAMSPKDLPSCREDPVIKTLDNPEFHSIFSPELRTLSKLFKSRNYDLRLAGGAVRDILMTIKPKDLDFATNATPDQMKSMFEEEGVRMVNNKGEKHGTITPRINDKENFEVTTLRIDVLTDGRHAKVQFTEEWKLDALRRDLTINSMFLDLDGRLYDYFYGYEDLMKRRVAFVGKADTRIKEDYLRIFRYFRFYGRVADRADNFDVETIKAIKANVDGLEGISGERIWSEWIKILSGRHGMELTLKMIECGIAKYTGLPASLNIENFRKVCTNGTSSTQPLKPITLLSAFLNSEEEVYTVNTRLKFSALERDLALFLVKHRDDKPSADPLKPYTRLLVHWKGKSEDARTFVSQLLNSKGLFGLAKRFDETSVPKFPINGHILKECVKNRKFIGTVMNELKDIWHDGDFKISTEELMQEVPRIVEEIEERAR